MAKVVHGGQKITAHRPIPPEGKLETTATLKGIYDLKRFATVILETVSTLDGTPLFGSEWSIIVRDEGGFKGPRPPKDDAPSLPKDCPADWTVEQATSPEQALLYRISGDTNPLHLDEEFASRTMFESRIAHGMLTASLVSTVLGTRLPGPGAVYVNQSLRFLAPVRIGDTVIARASVKELDADKRRVHMTTVCTVGDKKVLDGEAVLMLPRRQEAAE